MKDILDKLQYLSIPRREAEVYLALLQKKEFTAPEIGKITSISRTKSYEILQNLSKKGLCNENYKNGMKVYSATSPKIVFKNILAEYDKKKETAGELQEELMNLKQSTGHISESLDYIEIITEGEQIRERWLQIQGNTKKELLLFSKAPYALELQDNLDNERSLIKRKIDYKTIYEYGGIQTEQDKENFISIIESYEKIGEKIRLVKDLPMKLCISDELVTMLQLNDRVSLKPSITTMFVNHPSFSYSLKRVFESFWSSGMTFQEFKLKKKL